MGDGAIELSSESNATSKVWVEVARGHTANSDDSQEGVLGLESSREIMKTSEVSVTTSHNTEDLEMGRNDSVRRFEHV